MKSTIRSGVFETNSSSVHSIVIDTRTPYPRPDIDCVCDGGEFGWEHEFYQSVTDRLDYLWQAILTCYKSDKVRQEWRDTIHFWLPNVELIVPHEEDWYHYIDHAYELSDLLQRMKGDDELIGRFLLGDNSYVETWNDNIDGNVYEMFSYPQDPNYEVFEKRN